MKVLAIDGGGIRGIYSAHLLNRIKQEFGIRYHEYFDLIAGTSTGSIIAAALATDYPIEKVIDLYRQHGKQIFERKLFGWMGLFKSRYKSTNLRAELYKVFGSKTLSETKTRLLIRVSTIIT